MIKKNINKMLMREFRGKRILVTGGTGSVGTGIFCQTMKTLFLS